jgi:hypothetical protein
MLSKVKLAASFKLEKKINTRKKQFNASLEGLLKQLKLFGCNCEEIIFYCKEMNEI